MAENGSSVVRSTGARGITSNGSSAVFDISGHADCICSCPEPDCEYPDLFICDYRDTREVRDCFRFDMDYTILSKGKDALGRTEWTVRFCFSGSSDGAHPPTCRDITFSIPCDRPYCTKIWFMNGNISDIDSDLGSHFPPVPCAGVVTIGNQEACCDGACRIAPCRTCAGFAGWRRSGFCEPTFLGGKCQGWTIQNKMPNMAPSDFAYKHRSIDLLRLPPQEDMLEAFGFSLIVCDSQELWAKGQQFEWWQIGLSQYAHQPQQEPAIMLHREAPFVRFRNPLFEQNALRNYFEYGWWDLDGKKVISNWKQGRNFLNFRMEMIPWRRWSTIKEDEPKKGACMVHVEWKLRFSFSAHAEGDLLISWIRTYYADEPQTCDFCAYIEAEDEEMTADIFPDTIGTGTFWY